MHMLCMVQIALHSVVVYNTKVVPYTNAQCELPMPEKVYKAVAPTEAKRFWGVSFQNRPQMAHRGSNRGQILGQQRYQW